jgi:tetratricopeptide (TPR) repeat protein
MHFRALMLLAAVVAMACPVARADGPSDEAAKVHFQAGALHYKQGQYALAIEEFKAADRLRPSPILSYNIAQCYEKMADLGKARTYYQEYLQRSPEASDRSAIEATLASIDAQLAEAHRQPEVLVMPAPPLAAAAAAPVASVTAPPPSRNHTVSTVLFIVGGAGLATGVGLNIGSTSTANDLKNLSPPNGSQAQSLYDQSQNLWTGAVVGYAVGGAALAGGLIALLIENGGHSSAGATP